MAEVTGDLGGQPIQLNNAATEATLKQLLAAMTVIANNTGKDKAAQTKSQKELEAELKKLAAAAKKQQTAQDKLSESQKKAREETEKEIESSKKLREEEDKRLRQMHAIQAGMAQFGSAVAGLATGMTNMLSSLSKMGDSLEATAGVFGQLPIVGGVLGSMFGAVAGAAEKTYEAFKKSASVGANFGGSMTEMMDAATGAGLTFDQFSGIIAKTGKDLALLGGDSEAGARRLAALGKEIKGSPIARELNRLGYSTEAINEGIASYGAQLAKTGALQNMSNSQLIESTGAYLKDLDAVAKLTGQSKQELEDQRKARLADSQFRFTMRKLDAEGQKNLQNLMDSIPKEHQEGMKEIIATGTATSAAGRRALAFLPESAKQFMNLNQQIKTTGKLNDQQTAVMADAYQREAKRFADSPLAENMAKYGDEANKKFAVGAADAAARTKTYGEVQADATKAAAERAAKEKELQSKQLDPASMEAYKNKIAQTSNEFTKFLANSGLLDVMMSAFKDLVDIVQYTLVPAFQWTVDHFETITTVAGALIAGFIAFKSVVALATLKQSLQTLGLTFSLAPLATFAASLWAAVAPVLAVAAPFIAIGVAIVGTIAAIRALYKAGWDLGTIFEAVGDKLYDIFVLGMKDLFISILSFLPQKLGGYSKEEEKLARQSIAKEREDLKVREKSRDSARADKREARGIKEEEVQATEENTNASRRAARQKQKELEASEAARKAQEAKTEADKKAVAGPGMPGVNLSTPQAMYDSMVKRQQSSTAGAGNQPGAGSVGGGVPSSGGLGAMSEKYETGGRGNDTVGWDKVGGTSYGKYQISSKVGAMTDFLKFAESQGKGDVAAKLRASGIEKDTGGTSGKSVDLWKQMAKSGELGNLEHDFIKAKSFDPAMAGLKDQNLKKMIEGNKGLQEMMWSTSVQHGGGGAASIMNKVYKQGMSQEDLVKAVYAERGTKFGSSTAEVQRGVLNRFGKEQSDVFAMLGTPGTSTAVASTPSSSVPNTSSVQASLPTASTTSPQTADAARAAAAASDPRRTDRATTALAAGGARQETPESLLASLNTKMDQLIAINRTLKEVNERQLSVQGRIAQSGDLFASPV